MRISPIHWWGVFLFFLILTSLLFFLRDRLTPSPLTIIRINTTAIHVDIADTDEKRARGLSNRTSLEEDRGMLFIWDTPGRYGIWMKDMQFPIDIIWIGADKRVVDITKNATPASYPQIFEPHSPAQCVLEVNAGFADRSGVAVGDQVQF